MSSARPPWKSTTPSPRDDQKNTSKPYRESCFLQTLTVSFRKRRTFQSLYPNASPAAIDFLTRTLTFDPKKRFTVDQCLAHPYLEAYHDPEDEPSAKPLDPSFFEFDLQKEEISREQLKGLLYEEIMSFQSS
jgi:mitogen-activated protein kinase 1/3